MLQLIKTNWKTKEVKAAYKSLIAGIVVGVLVLLITGNPQNSLNFAKELYKDLLPNLHKDFLTIYFSIFRTNITASFFIIGLGLIHRFLPKAIIFLNGYFMGFILSGVLLSTLGGILFYLLPHGIFEIPALIFATALGISLTTKSRSLKERFVVLFNSKKDLLLIIILLLIAAFMESLLIVLKR